MLPDLCGGQTGDRSLSSVCIDVEESLQHTLDVAIHNRDWLAKCNAGDGGSGVTSDARQSLKIFCPLRKPAGVLLHDLFSALVQTARSPIVAQAAPCGEYCILRLRGERFNTWKTFEEIPVVFEDSGHTRLLQHNFAEPDAVGIASLAPREIAAIPVVPAKERPAKRGQGVLLVLVFLVLVSLVLVSLVLVAGRSRSKPRLDGDG
jgi:hypothetical protein